MKFYNMHHTRRDKLSLYEFRNEVIGALLPPAPEQPLRTPPRNIQHRMVKTENETEKETD